MQASIICKQKNIFLDLVKFRLVPNHRKTVITFQIRFNLTTFKNTAVPSSPSLYDSNQKDFFIDERDSKTSSYTDTVRKPFAALDSTKEMINVSLNFFYKSYKRINIRYFQRSFELNGCLKFR